jgi:SulP family sulfate permease
MKQNTGIFSNIKGDVFGGVTAGIVALPLALAFGEQTELGAISGLYGAIALGIFAAILGGTKTQISGPTAPMTVVSAVVISEAIDRMGSLEAAWPVIVATFVMAGIMEGLLGVMKLGKYIKFIPYPVVSGFMSGIGVIIIITQIFPFFGASSPAGGAFGTVQSLHQIPEVVNIISVGIALGTIAIIYILPKFTKKVPATLVALVIISLAVYFLVPIGDVTKINSNGPIPTGLPKISFNFLKVFGDWEVFLMVAEYASTLAALGAIDSLLTSVVADNKTKTKHNSDRELIGQGAGNIIAGLLGGLPGAGATMRTVINIDSGGKTRISGLIAGLFLLAILLGLGALVGHIPNAVLAGILITVGIGIIDYKGLAHIRLIPRTDAFIMLIVFGLTVFVDLLVAVAAGMVLSSLLFMKKASDIVTDTSNTQSLEDFKPEKPWKDEEGLIKQYGKHVYIKHLNGPLFFGATSGFSELMTTLPDIKVVLIRMHDVPYVDQSGLYAMEDAILALRQKGIKVLVMGLSGQPKVMFEKIQLVPNLVENTDCLDNISDCENWLVSNLEEIEENKK